MISAPVSCRRLVGRQAELKSLIERYREVAGCRGSLVLVAGEAGIGKSRFLAEASVALAQAGATWVSTQCLEHTQSPLGPFVDVLRELHEREPRLLAESTNLRLALGHLLPELLDPTSDAARIGEDRHGQFAAIAEALRRFGACRPTVVAIDDAHWADLATLDCVQYLTGRIAPTSLLLIVSYRSDELHRRHPLTALLRKLQRLDAVRTLELLALSDADVRLFANEALEGHRAIIGLAEGNPLFLEELLKHALERKRGGDGRIDLPLSVRAAVLERMEAFDEAERTTLVQAAVVGRRFDPEFLARVTNLGVDEVTTALRRARDAQLVVEERGTLVHYAFRHALIREALYSELLATEARRLHARIATELESLPPMAGRDIELAYHSWSARDPERGASFNERAGDLSMQRLAYAEAATFYERALELLPSDGEHQARLHEKSGMALRLADLPEQARRAYEHALAFHRTTGDWEKIAELEAQIARQYWLALEMERALEWRFKMLEATQRHPEHPLHCAALMHIANHYALSGDEENARTYAERVAAFRGNRERRNEIGFHNAWGIIEQLRGDAPAAIAHYRESIALAGGVEDPHTGVMARFNLGYVATPFGEFGIATEAFEAAVALARERFVLGFEAYALAGFAMLHLLAGDPARSRELVLEGAGLLVAPMPGLRLQLGATAILAGLRLGDDALVERFAREELIDLAFRSLEAQRIVPVCAAFAELYAQRGRRNAAAALLHRAFASVKTVGPAPWGAVTAAL